jgi:hypothetical protein
MTETTFAIGDRVRITYPESSYVGCKGSVTYVCAEDRWCNVLVDGDTYANVTVAFDDLERIDATEMDGNMAGTAAPVPATDEVGTTGPDAPIEEAQAPASLATLPAPPVLEELTFEPVRTTTRRMRVNVKQLASGKYQSDTTYELTSDDPDCDFGAEMEAGLALADMAAREEIGRRTYTDEHGVPGSDDTPFG